MNIFTVSFFGHRYIDNLFKVRDKIVDLAQGLIRSNEYVEFLVGRDGDFDIMAASAVKKAKKEFSDLCCLVWVMPYIKAEYTENEKEFNEYYDMVEVCAESEIVHPKAAYKIRNQAMIDMSDLVVFYVKRKSGGAYSAMKYADKQGKAVINLADLE